jgi:4a-hydroxytetrahydrobiopterin dehydratase
MTPPPARRALNPSEVVIRLTELNGTRPQGWMLIDGAIEKRFQFADFLETMAFANAVAYIAHQADHHPELRVSHGRCTVRFHTHDAHGITVTDFDCAAQVDALHP